MYAVGKSYVVDGLRVVDLYPVDGRWLYVDLSRSYN
jgi:hypothetical protein